jgi:hypothetical protein
MSLIARSYCQLLTVLQSFNEAFWLDGQSIRRVRHRLLNLEELPDSWDS